MSSLAGNAGPSERLHQVLIDLHRSPYPHVPNPPECTRRASVALILRIRPTYEQWPTKARNNGVDAQASISQRLDTFFSQPWVQAGDPEVLFIKRAARKGDRWAGHVALPGGKRDSEDEDDKAAAVREASEEIGMDLNVESCLYVGNLPERVVTTFWGKVALMVLCPYIFLLTDPNIPPLRLQPSEVASTHWVPLRALLSPQLRDYEYVDLSERFAKQGGRPLRLVLRALLGKMMFSAIRLIPSETLYCSSIERFIPDQASSPRNTLLGLSLQIAKPKSSADIPQPILLWGLTLGIMADFLNLLPPHNAVNPWEYPTFTTPDLRWIIRFITYSLRKRNFQRLQSGLVLNQTAIDSQTAAIAVPDPSERIQHETGIGGLGVGRYDGQISHTDPRYKSHAVGVMFEGYYERLRVAIAVFLCMRAALGSTALYMAVRWFKRRR